MLNISKYANELLLKPTPKLKIWDVVKVKSAILLNRESDILCDMLDFCGRFFVISYIDRNNKIFLSDFEVKPNQHGEVIISMESRREEGYWWQKDWLQRASKIELKALGFPLVDFDGGCYA